MQDLNVRQINTNQHLQHLLGLGINFNGVHIQNRLFRDIVVSPLTLFFLKFDRNTTHCLVLETFHQMCDEPRLKGTWSILMQFDWAISIPGNFVSKRFAGDDGNLFTDAFVGMEIQRQSSVVFLDDELGSFLDGLGTNSTLKSQKKLPLNFITICDTARQLSRNYLPSIVKKFVQINIETFSNKYLR